MAHLPTKYRGVYAAIVCFYGDQPVLRTENKKLRRATRHSRRGDLGRKALLIAHEGLTGNVSFISGAQVGFGLENQGVSGKHLIELFNLFIECIVKPLSEIVKKKQGFQKKYYS